MPTWPVREPSAPGRRVGTDRVDRLGNAADQRRLETAGLQGPAEAGSQGGLVVEQEQALIR